MTEYPISIVVVLVCACIYFAVTAYTAKKSLALAEALANETAEAWSIDSVEWREAMEAIKPREQPVYQMRRRGRDVLAHEYAKGNSERGDCSRCQLSAQHRNRVPWKGCRPDDAATWLNGDGNPIPVTCVLCGDVGTAKSQAQASQMHHDHVESRRHRDAMELELRAEADEAQRAVEEFRARHRAEA